MSVLILLVFPVLGEKFIERRLFKDMLLKVIGENRGDSRDAGRGQRPSHLWGAMHASPLATGTVAIFTPSTLSYLLFWSATHWIVVIMCKLDMCQPVSDLTPIARYSKNDTMVKAIQRRASRVFSTVFKKLQSQGWTFPCFRVKT